MNVFLGLCPHRSHENIRLDISPDVLENYQEEEKWSDKTVAVLSSS